MYSLKDLQRKVLNRLEILEYPSQPKELYEPISYILSLGGKRLRPSLVLMGCNLFNENVEQALDAATGIEVFHNFTLLHDDIMDKAPLRRNQPTVHEKWNSNIAILSGDTMFVHAYQLMMHVPDAILREVLDTFSRTAIEVCEGQQLDMNFEGSNDVTIADYEEMIRLKTAVLLGAALKIGSLIGGAKTGDAENLYQFGVNLGVAFQLQDDILDVYGDQDKFGKQVGGDIIANKKTFLLLKALEITKGASHTQLLSLIGQAENSLTNQEKVEAVTSLFNEAGIRQEAEQEMAIFYEKALGHLSQINIPEERKTVLKQFAEELMVREV